MFIHIVEICPLDIWKKEDIFYFMAYHTSVFLDYYMTFPVRTYYPSLPYVLLPDDQLPSESIDDVIPERHYRQIELISLIKLARSKCDSLNGPLTQQDISVNWIEKHEIALHGLCPSIVEEYTLVEILFYNFRHIQHHVGQLNYILTQNL